MSESRAHVALLVDVANLRAGLLGDSAAAAPAAPGTERWGTATPAEIARALVRYAGQVGRVVLARAYADWLRLGSSMRDMAAARLEPVLVPASAQGEDRSHIRLTVDALQSLFAGDEPEAFLLVTSDATLVPLVQALRADGSEVTVLSSAAAVNEELKAEADRFVLLEDVLAGEAGVPAAARDRSADAAESAAAAPAGREAARPLTYPRAETTDAPRPRSSRSPHPTPISGPEIDFAAYEWGPFVHLVDELEQRLPFVGVRYLVNKVLVAHNCGTEDPRLKRDLINRAMDDGLIEMFPVGNVGERADPVTACRLDRANSVVLGILGPSSAPVPPNEDPLRRSALPAAGGLATD